MSEKITFKELVELIAEQSKQSQNAANSFIHELVQIIESGLKKSGSVSISGFGKFELRWMNERAGVHPQTGEEITIPGQNKVVFKPYKALREEVNKPFANLKSRLIRENIPGASAPLPEPAPDDVSVEEKDPKDVPFGVPGIEKSSKKDLPPIDELLIERDKPTSAAAMESALPEEDKAAATVPAMVPTQAKVVKEVQESGGFKWTYAAAVVIALAAFIILFYLMQRTTDGGETLTTSDQQTEQQVLPPLVPAIEPEGEEPATETEGPPDDGFTDTEESPPPAETEAAQDDAPAVQTEFETETLTVEAGQSLWTIAQTELGNPYLWPLLYHLNGDIMANPNQLPAAADLEIPQISDPEALNPFEREQVAHGYFSLYEWTAENNPDEARYFLWAVGVFSPEMLDTPPSEVDPDDLAFARNR